MPTIVNMTAPKGYKFHSFGQSLVTDNKNEQTDKERLAIGAQSIANGRFIYNGGGLNILTMKKKIKMI